MVMYFDLSSKYCDTPVAYYGEQSSWTENNCQLFRNHIHLEIEILALLSGEIKVSLDGKNVTMNDGDILIIPPFCPHEALVSRPCELRTECICFPTAMLCINEWKTDSHDQKLLSSFHVMKKEEPITQLILEQLLAITKAIKASPTEHAKEVKERMMILGSLLRRYIQPNEESEERHDDANDFNYRVASTVMSQYATELNSKCMAKILNYSHGYFCRRFRQEFGMTFSDYVNAYRLNVARELLARNQYSITEVVFLTGFSSQSYFTKLYKERFGTLPSLYKNVELAHLS